MQKEKIKVYTYTRVSTAMQVDGLPESPPLCRWMAIRWMHRKPK